MIVSKRASLIILIGLVFFSLAGAALAQETCGKLPFKPQIGIPGSNFQAGSEINVDCASIGNYIIALYTFGVYAASIIAAVMLMVGGFLWLTSGGNASQVTTAKTFVGGALSGFVLLLTSWVLLNTINPDLVKFRPLSVQVLEHVPIPEEEQFCCTCLKNTPDQTDCSIIKSLNTRGNCLCPDGKNIPNVPTQSECSTFGEGCLLKSDPSLVENDAKQVCDMKVGTGGFLGCTLSKGTCDSVNACELAAVAKGQAGACVSNSDCKPANQYSCNFAYSCDSTNYRGSPSSTITNQGCCKKKQPSGAACGDHTDCVSSWCETDSSWGFISTGDPVGKCR